MRTHDCDPTLTDSQVLDFCKTGYLPLEGVVPDDVNQRVVEFMDDHAPHIEPGDFANHEPNEILDEDWFIDGVICNPAAAGAVRTLLGPNFTLPPIMSSHRVHMPARAYGWHRDGGSLSSHELNYLQVYYYPQDTTLEMGGNGVSAWLAPVLAVRAGQLRALRHVPRFGVERGARWVDLHFGLFRMAPTHAVDGIGHSQSAEIQLLAHLGAPARLGAGAGFRYRDGRLRTGPRCRARAASVLLGRGAYVLLAIRAPGRLSGAGRPGLAEDRAGGLPTLRLSGRPHRSARPPAGRLSPRP